MSLDKLPLQMAATAVFVRVVELKSFSGAARALGLSKSAVSKQVGRLEALLGTQLLRRTTRSLSLTQAGELLYEQAAQAVALLSSAASDVVSFADQPRGLLRVTAPVTFGRLCVVPLLKAFLSSHPHIQTQLVLLDRPVDLAAEGFDVALRLTPKLPADLIARPLGSTRYSVVVKPGYFSRRAMPRTPTDLAHVNCLRYDNTDALSTWHFFRPNGGSAKVRVSGNLAVNNSESLHELVLSGTGVAVLPSFVVDTSLRTGRLQEVLRGWSIKPPFATDAHIVWLPDRRLTPKTRAFIDFLVASRLSTDNGSTRSR